MDLNLKWLIPLIMLSVLTSGQETAMVKAEVTVDKSKFSATGRIHVSITVTAEEKITEPLRVLLSIRDFEARTLSKLDHLPPTPSMKWKVGRAVTWSIPVRLPLLPPSKNPIELDVYLGLQGNDGKIRVIPGTATVSDGTSFMVSFKVKPSDTETTADSVKDIIRDARAAETGGHPGRAFAMLEQALRRATTEPIRSTLRDALRRVGKKAPEAITPVEESIVEARIFEERRRYLREVAGRMNDRGQYHGALAILKEIGGDLSEGQDQAVIGALSDAKRDQKDWQDIKRRLLEAINDADSQTAARLIEDLGRTPKLLDAARDAAKNKQYAVARRVLSDLRFAEDEKLRSKTYRLLKETEDTWLLDIPPTQAAVVKRATKHPAWDRTDHTLSHKFIIIGPRNLVKSIPDRSKLEFDLAYIFLTDLFGRVPNPAGDRVTVYFKELWDFGGGVGGGKIINIGRAQPNARKTNIDTGLLFHELTHCVDDTNPIYAGFREGLANFGAAFCFEMLGRDGDLLHSFDSNLSAFLNDYIATDLEYWRIQNYGPSAGFFLHFLDSYSRLGKGHDWEPYRRFFRMWRQAHSRDSRESNLVRSLTAHLMEVFDDHVFDDMMEFRFPLVESDRKAILSEKARLEEHASEPLSVIDQSDFLDHPRSPIPRDVSLIQLTNIMRSRQSPDVVSRFAREELGMVDAWRVIGPFKTDAGSVDAMIFPPEYEIDFAKKYSMRANTCRWVVARDKAPARLHPHGWVQFDFAYQNNSAIYSLSHVTIDKAQSAVAHFRSDDNVTLFINDELVGKYHNSGRSRAPRWGPRLNTLPDAMRLPVQLKAGRNKVLVKVHNRFGGSGFALAFTTPDLLPISGMTSDSGPVGDVRSEPQPSKLRSTLRQSFRSRSFRAKLKVAGGRFAVRSKHLVGEVTGGGIPWRKYTVRPGFPKDSPSNLLWLAPKLTKGIADFELHVSFRSDGGKAPKFAIPFNATGLKDPLSGWTLILHPGRGGRVICRLERYDRLVYLSDSEWLPPSGKRTSSKLVLRQNGTRIDVKLNGQELLRNVPIRPIPGAQRIGLCTWGPTTQFESMELLR